jgi:hypothetical protein
MTLAKHTGNSEKTEIQPSMKTPEKEKEWKFSGVDNS